MMSHQNIFNSAAERARVERNFKIFNRAALISGLVGLGCFGAILYGSEDRAVVAGAAFGIISNVFTGDYRRKKESQLLAAKSDVYTP
jgi:hypothetical protein